MAAKRAVLRKVEKKRLTDEDKPGRGDSVRLKRTGEVGRIVHVFSVHPFKGDVVVLVGSAGSFAPLTRWTRWRIKWSPRPLTYVEVACATCLP